MAKVLGGFIVGILIGAIVGVGIGWSIDWRTVRPFGMWSYGVSSPDLKKLDLMHFQLADAPKYSSRHFFFRNGGPDCIEYWAFDLPPEQAREFIDEYVDRCDLESTAEGELPITTSFICDGHEDWREDLWIGDRNELSETYASGTQFCGYDEEKNRVYLMNWDE